MDARLRALAERMMRFASEHFDHAGEVSPMWHAVDTDGNCTIVATPWGTNAEKDMIAQGLRVMFKERNITHYGLMTEAWMATAKSMDDIPYGSLEHVKGRKEIIMVTVENAAHESITLHREIIRPKDGEPYLKPIEVLDKQGTGFEGRFSKLLERNAGLGLQ